MRAILDTNIIIHRENVKVTNKSVGLLYFWLDRLHYDKLIHPFSINELRKFDDDEMQSIYDVKLESYIIMKTIAPQSDDFKKKLRDVPKSENDLIDNQLLCEVYCKRADILITEDRKMRRKAEALGIGKKVLSINSFIERASADNPDLVSYKALMVKKEYMGNINIADDFFDSLRNSYNSFNDWFARKSDEEAYVCRSDDGSILGFMYLKTEFEGTDYHDITPRFKPKRRLKVGTFKIESTGFRLGERFIKIMFDNAINRAIDEIYVTLFPDKQDLIALKSLLMRWGFCEYGIKVSASGTESVLVKKLDAYDKNKSIKENFPVVDYNYVKRFLPIKPEYHTTLLPDSQLNTEMEIDFMKGVSHRYALQKVYVTWGLKYGVQEGDILVFYRIGDRDNKRYSSVVTTVGVIESIKNNFEDEQHFLDYCQDRSVFSYSELHDFWRGHKRNLAVIRFIYICNLNKRLTLDYLWKNNIVEPYGGPRPFDIITDEQFEKIINDSKTNLFKAGD